MLTVICSHWNSHGHFKWPSLVQALNKAFGVYSKVFCPLMNAPSFASKLYDVVGAPIAALLFGGCPPAIAGSVTLAVVNPVNGKAFRPLSHVGNKVVIRFPSRINRDAPRTVPMELMIGWLGTSIAHVKPGYIGRIPAPASQRGFHGGVSNSQSSVKAALVPLRFGNGANTRPLMKYTLARLPSQGDMQNLAGVTV